MRRRDVNIKPNSSLFILYFNGNSGRCEHVCCEDTARRLDTRVPVFRMIANRECERLPDPHHVNDTIWLAAIAKVNKYSQFIGAFKWLVVGRRVTPHSLNADTNTQSAQHMHIEHVSACRTIDHLTACVCFISAERIYKLHFSNFWIYRAEADSGLMVKKKNYSFFTPHLEIKSEIKKYDLRLPQLITACEMNAQAHCPQPTHRQRYLNMVCLNVSSVPSGELTSGQRFLHAHATFQNGTRRRVCSNRR